MALLRLRVRVSLGVGCYLVLLLGYSGGLGTAQKLFHRN